MNHAPLRHHLTERLGAPHWRRRVELPTAEALAARPDVPLLFRLAHSAVGDVDSAAVLLADMLLTAPPHPAAAIRQLIADLPAGWLNWPGEAGPADWLALRLRPQQAHRLLSILGEGTPTDRIALTLYLLEDVHRDDLDAWLGVTGMAVRVSTLIESAASRLGLTALPSADPACQAVAADLLDAEDGPSGSVVRRHTFACPACQARVRGIQHTKQLLARALQVCFRAPVPSSLPRLIAVRRALAA